jgi:hypothetical protein
MEDAPAPDSTTTPDTANERRVAGWILIATFLANVLAWAGIASERGFDRRPSEVDGYSMYAYLPSVILDGDLDFTNQYERISLPVDVRLWTPNRIERSGLPDNIYGVGYAMLTAPAFLAAHAVTLAVGSETLPPDGYSTLYRVATTLSALAYTWLGLLFTFRIGRRYLPPVPVALGVALLWSGTNLAYYTTDNLSMSEGVSLGLFAVLSWLAIEIHERREHRYTWLLAGLVAGVLSVTHFLNGILLLVPAILVGHRLAKAVQAGDREDARRTFAGGLVFLAAAILAAIPQLLVWKSLYGEWLVFTYGQKESGLVGFNWFDPALLQILTSPLNGYLYWSPVALLGFIGLTRLARFRGDLPLTAILVTTLVTYYCLSSWWCWWFGDAFGNRGFIRLGMPIALGLAASIDALWPHHRRALLGIATLATAWNFWLMTLHITHAIKPQGAVPFRAMIAATRKLLENL